MRHIKDKKGERKGWLDDVCNATKKVRGRINPAEGVLAHWNALEAFGIKYVPEKARGHYNGAVLEVCLYAGFVALGIPEDRMGWNVYLGKHGTLEVDIIIYGNTTTWMFHCKASFRERWKQAFNTATLIKWMPLIDGKGVLPTEKGYAVIVFAREYVGDSVEKTIAKAAKIAEKTAGVIDEVIAVGDTEAMKRIFKMVRDDVLGKGRR